MEVSYKIKDVERGPRKGWVAVVVVKETCEWNWLRKLFGREIKEKTYECEVFSEYGSIWYWSDTGKYVSDDLMTRLDAQVKKIEIGIATKPRDVKVNPYFLGEKK